MPISFVHDPTDVDDYSVDWGARRLGDGETLSTSTWTLPVGITVDPDNPSLTTKTTTTTTIWITGGTDGVDYDLVNHVTTNQGREWDHTITIMARNK